MEQFAIVSITSFLCALESGPPILHSATECLHVREASGKTITAALVLVTAPPLIKKKEVLAFF